LNNSTRSRNYSTSKVQKLQDIPGNGQRLQMIVQHYQQQLYKIDSLQRRLNELSVQCRKRISSLIEQVPVTRISQLRFFVPHSYQSSTSTIIIPKQPAVWTLNKEGIMLIDYRL
jgi:hypothetical protein